MRPRVLIADTVARLNGVLGWNRSKPRASVMNRLGGSLALPVWSVRIISMIAIAATHRVHGGPGG